LIHSIVTTRGRARRIMVHPIRTLLSALALSLLLSASGVAAQQAQDDALVISTGREGGNYSFIASRLKRVMLSQHQTVVEVVPTRGSLENLIRLDDPSSNVSLALTQADVLAAYIEKKPEFTDRFIVLGDIGNECAILVTGSHSSLETVQDLKSSQGTEISVDTAHSGAALTLRQMTLLEPGFAKLTPVYVDVMQALLQIKVPSPHSKLRALMLVQRPSAVPEPVRIVLDNPESYRVVPILESDVGNIELPDGSLVYTFEQIAVGGRARPESIKVETLCTRGLLLASKSKLSRDTRSGLSRTMLQSGDEIIGKTE
jgi:hypothetical protein